jgi:glycine hydroxymethyltransferase
MHYTTPNKMYCQLPKYQHPKPTRAVNIRAQAFLGHNKPIQDVPLSVADDLVYNLINKEKKRQIRGLQLIASENFTSTAVMEALGSCMTNKYSEGRPNKRYYAGNEFIDKLEILCEQRAIELFKLDPNEWGVNVQPLSGSPANFAVYTALLKPHDRIMGLDLPDGGHLTHGYVTKSNKKISASSVYFESMPYRISPETGFINYDELYHTSQLFRPNLIIAGASSYSRHIDYRKMRQIADNCGAYLMADIAHISGLVASNLSPSPFPFADIVTTTTHKSLRGPRGGMIYYKNKYKQQIDNAVFPGIQGGPHNHTIAALAVALKQANTPEFKAYQEQVIKNTKVMCQRLRELKYKIVSLDTDNHLFVIDLKPMNLNGTCVQNLLEKLSITVNKNSVPGDNNAVNPGGIRVGTYAITSRGFKEHHVLQVASYINRGIQLAKCINQINEYNLDKFDDYLNNIKEMRQDVYATIIELQQEVESFSSSFPMPGL